MIKNVCAIRLLSLLILFGFGSHAWADDGKIAFEKQTLDNGLTVIYAPLLNAPVVHVRVLYHVGSRDEAPDRQGFAHMFEHMMFRGSQHVPPQQHMKLIGVAGGDSNAFTSFDQTTYTNTLPSNNTQMALYLEADRMASFKVNDEIFKTERKVVAEEWRMRYANQPLGPMYADLLKTAFGTHNYRWTPIGDMDQLRRASSSELQTFFNHYYVPNNATLIVAGDIDIPQTKKWVEQYFGWIPKGEKIDRVTKSEPKQVEARRLVVEKPNVPLTNIYMAFKTVGYKSDDHYALSLLGDVLSSGRTGRLDQSLVYGQTPMCVQVGAGDFQLEDPSLFLVSAVVNAGVNPDEVEKKLLAELVDVAGRGVTEEELEKVRTQARQQIIRSRETCDDIAEQLGEEEVFGGDAGRVNSVLDKINALTPADLQRVAKTYLDPKGMTVVQYRPAADGAEDPAVTPGSSTGGTGVPTTTNSSEVKGGVGEAKSDASPDKPNSPASAPSKAEVEKKFEQIADAEVAPSSQPVKRRIEAFPGGYPEQPPVNEKLPGVSFNKGVEGTVDGVKVITISDRRLPLVNVTLIMPGGSDAEPADKVGLGDLTAAMLRRGSGERSFMQLSQDLESRGITIEAADNNDNTRLNIACTTDQLDYAIARANEVLNKPTFPEDELRKLQQQMIGGLMQSLANPSTVATRQLTQTLYGDSPRGRVTTPESIAGVTIEDVRKFYEQYYQKKGAFVVISGDVTEESGATLAEKLLADVKAGDAPKQATYTLPDEPSGKIVVVNNSSGQQATIRLGLRAYDITSEDKFAGSVAGQVLSAGIDSRLGQYLRAERGLTYGSYAFFRPNRHGGEFFGSVDTDNKTAADAITGMLKVFGDMSREPITQVELNEAKSRVAGGVVMEMQTTAQQAQRRIDQILNNYPIDYYDTYAEKIAEVTPEQVTKVMARYVDPGRILYVCVAPTKAVLEQLQKLGSVEVVDMPLKLKKPVFPASKPAGEK